MAKKVLYCISIEKQEMQSPRFRNLNWKQASKQVVHVANNSRLYAEKYGWGQVNITKQKSQPQKED